MVQKINKMMAMLGPGLLWAGAAVGVSHLVQSTKAGAIYGFALVGIVLLANLFKYPFFEYGPRYAAATGKTLLTGYKKLGNWAFALYLIVTVLTMFAIQAAVTTVTAGVVTTFFPDFVFTDFQVYLVSGAVLVLSAIVLVLGHYPLLDKMVKYIIIFLTGATAVAVVIAGINYTPPSAEAITPVSIWSFGGISFMVALMGWMPSAIDISVWSSIWTTEKKKENPEATTLKNSLFDFNVGYIGTVFIALGFLTLGALVIHGTGVEIAAAPGAFASQLVDMYATTIGPWSRWIVAIAALATMVSTTVTCLDAYGRVLSKSTSLIRKGHDEDESTYLFWIVITIIGAMLLLGRFVSNMGMMIKLATTLSFLTAPILAFLNFKVILGKDVPEDAKPPKWLRMLSVAGIIFLSGFSILYIWTVDQKKKMDEAAALAQSEVVVCDSLPCDSVKCIPVVSDSLANDSVKVEEVDTK